MATAPSPGIYSATYSGIPVYEYQFGAELKEHVMRRRSDNWINATHILKAAGFDKPARTRILEREVQKDIHEKIQGGYGKYQGTWIPLDAGEALAQRNNCFDRIRPIFEYTPGDVSPPPAPRHASKPKAPRAPRPVVPKWSAAASASVGLSAVTNAAAASAAAAAAAAQRAKANIQMADDESVVGMGDDDTPDNLTVASASCAADDDMASQGLPGQGGGLGPSFAAPEASVRKRKREQQQQQQQREFEQMQLLQDMTEQQHAMYGDELLDYFLLSRNEQPTVRPEPPTNFKPDWVIDTERHTALHWACAMGDVEVVKQLKRFGATLDVRNDRGETPFMRAVSFTNCFEKQTFPAIMKELFDTVDVRDVTGSTIIHHAAIMKSGRVTSQSCARYYLDLILNRLQETHDLYYVQQLIDAQDSEGNTAIHLAAMKHASKCIRALLGRGASTDIPNADGVCAEDLIKELNATKKARAEANAAVNPTAADNSKLDSISMPLTIQAMSAMGSLKPMNGHALSSLSQLNSNGNRAVATDNGLMAPHRSSSPFAPDSQRRPGLRDVFADKLRNPLLAMGSAGALDNQTFQSDAANTVQSRITSLVFEKFQDLAQNYEDEYREKADAEKEARRILGNTQSELQAIHREIADLEVRIESDDAEAQIARDAAMHQQQLAALITRRNILSIEQKEPLPMSDAVDTNDTHHLIAELKQLVAEQKQAETDYLDALAAVGTSGNIEKYRRLLRSCLGPESDSLEDNLDGMISMLEEEVSDAAGCTTGGDAMEISV